MVHEYVMIQGLILLRMYFGSSQPSSPGQPPPLPTCFACYATVELQYIESAATGTSFLVYGRTSYLTVEVGWADQRQKKNAKFGHHDIFSISYLRSTVLTHTHTLLRFLKVEKKLGNLDTFFMKVAFSLRPPSSSASSSSSFQRRRKKEKFMRDNREFPMPRSSPSS